MEKTKIIVCDICKERIAKEKCRLCKNDICEGRGCKKEFMVKLGSSGEGIISVPFCRECWNKIGDNLVRNKEFWDKEFIEKIYGNFEDYIRKKVILNKLEGKEK